MPSRRQDQPNALGQFLDAVLQKRGITDADFCRIAGIKKGTYSLLKHRPPSELPKSLALAHWGKALGLNSTEMEALQLAAALAWSPALIQGIIPSPVPASDGHSRKRKR